MSIEILGYMGVMYALIVQHYNYIKSTLTRIPDYLLALGELCT